MAAAATLRRRATRSARLHEGWRQGEGRHVVSRAREAAAPLPHDVLAAVERRAMEARRVVPALFAVRLVDLDVEYAKPVEDLDAYASPLTGRRLRSVPTIRIFGGTPRGQKALVHVHGVFRYFLVPIDGERSTDRESLCKLAEELEAELRRGNDKLVGDHALVFDMTVESLLPFYGYHEEKRPFLKVSMVQPGHVQPAARLFTRGFANRRPRQPHEAHIPYLLQFKVDYNLLGMDFVRLSRVRWRGALPEQPSAEELSLATAGGRDDVSAAAAVAVSDAAAAGGSAAAAAGSTAGPAAAGAAAPPPTGRTQSRLREPGFRCVWARGRTHGLELQSPAQQRVSCVELEADALANEILNPHDVIYEPLQAARAEN